MTRWHKQFLSMLPKIRAYAKFAFRHLKPEPRAEAVQEVVCNALKAFVRLVQRRRPTLPFPPCLPVTVFAKPGRSQGRG